MYIDWEKIAKISGKGFLLFLEYCVKLTAIAVTGVVLMTDGTFGTKLGTGFGSVSSTLRSIFSAPSDIIDNAHIIHEYNTMSAAAFNQQYGADAIHGVMAYLNGAVVYFQTVFQNLAAQPFSTFFAAVISFFSLYMLSLVLRFARQKGQGSYLNKLERKLADRVYETSRRLNNPPAESKPEPVSKPKPKPRAKKKDRNLFDNKSGKINRHLQDYMSSVQSG